MDCVFYNEIIKDLSPSAPLSQFNQSRKGIVDEPIARHGQSCAVMAGDRSAASDEARKLNFWSIIEGAILHYCLGYNFLAVRLVKRVECGIFILFEMA